MELKSYLTQRQALIHRELERFLPPARAVPGPIHRAMRYSVLGEGKRIRPILALAACEAVGGRVKIALPAACALELIHAYSLVHDDLPAMDNDDFRRGKPSCHKKFGEALGILTGDALLTYAFELLSYKNHDPAVRLKVIQEISRAIGTRGMIGGQVEDVVSTQEILQAGRRISPTFVNDMNARKTGALIAASVRIGALLGGASSARYQALSLFGDRVGLMFQLVDDLLDGDGLVRLLGPAAVRRQAERLTEEAISALKPLGNRARILRVLAEFILNRGS